MNKHKTSLVLVIAGAMLFNLVFWQEKMGINTILFDAFIVSTLFYLYAEARQSAAVRWLLLGHLTCLAMILVHNTDVSRFGFIVTLTLLAGFVTYKHRSAWFAGGTAFLNFTLFPASFIQEWSFGRKQVTTRNNQYKWIRFVIIPGMLVGVFFIIYLLSNNVLFNMTSNIAEKISRFLQSFIDVSTWQRFLFLLFGLYLTGALLLRANINYFSRKEQQYQDALIRVRKSWPHRMRQPLFNLLQTVMGRLSTGMMALRNEYITGLISLALLNGLLLIVNIIDINYLWINFQYSENVVLYKLLHEGTELLIISIVLAMLVLLFFFKGNLNFYRKNKWLKYGAYLWILQNIILVSSVLLRDYYYILKYGLAYKRIGVLFFLLMVLVGLSTVFIKIWQKKSTYFLFRINAWAGIVLLVAASCIHWDEFIAGYNLQRKDKVPLDVAFLLTLSDKTLPLLDRNKDALKQRQRALQESSFRSSSSLPIVGFCDTCFEVKLRYREERFLKAQQQLSWLSWNYADDYVQRYFQHRMVNPPAVNQ